MNWLLNRLKERSTWLAIFTLAGLFGMKIEPELREHIINAILAVAAVAAFVFRENIRERSTDLPAIELQGRSDSPAKRDADSASQSNPVDSDLEESEYLELHKEATTSNHANDFVSGSSPAPRRRSTDDWLRDPVPSEAGFKRPGTPNHELVGWNDDD